MAIGNLLTCIAPPCIQDENNPVNKTEATPQWCDFYLRYNSWNSQRNHNHPDG